MGNRVAVTLWQAPGAWSTARASLYVQRSVGTCSTCTCSVFSARLGGLSRAAAANFAHRHKQPRVRRRRGEGALQLRAHGHVLIQQQRQRAAGEHHGAVREDGQVVELQPHVQQPAAVARHQRHVL